MIIIIIVVYQNHDNGHHNNDVSTITLSMVIGHRHIISNALGVWQKIWGVLEMSIIFQLLWLVRFIHFNHLSNCLLDDKMGPLQSNTGEPMSKTICYLLMFIVHLLSCCSNCGNAEVGFQLNHRTGARLSQSPSSRPHCSWCWVQLSYMQAGTTCGASSQRIRPRIISS